MNWLRPITVPKERPLRIYRGLDECRNPSHWNSKSGTKLLTYAGPHGGYGLTVVVDHGRGWATLYGHLACATVRPNQIVQQAAVIGAVGSTGTSTGPHLHFEIRYRGVPVNPLAYLSR